MTATKVNPISEKQHKYLTQQFMMVTTALFDINQEDFTFTLSGLTQLQHVLDLAPVESVSLQAVSIVFAEIFLTANPEYKWVSVDKVNKSESRLAIQYLNTTVVWYRSLRFTELMGRIRR